VIGRKMAEPPLNLAQPVAPAGRLAAAAVLCAPVRVAGEGPAEVAAVAMVVPESAPGAVQGVERVLEAAAAAVEEAAVAVAVAVREPAASVQAVSPELVQGQQQSQATPGTPEKSPRVLSGLVMNGRSPAG